MWRTDRSLYIVVELCSGEEFRLSDCHLSIDYDICFDSAGVSCSLGKNHNICSTHMDVEDANNFYH